MKKGLINLKNNKGMSYFFVMACFIGILALSLVLFEYFRISTISAALRNKFEDALVTISVANYAEIYASNREAFASSYSYYNGQWVNANSVSKRNIETEVFTALNGGEENQITNISNISFSVTESKTRASEFRVQGSCNVTLPYVFFWDGEITLTIAADTYWQAQF